MSNIQNKRNEGSLLGSGQKLYIRAKNIIPGGTMLFSNDLNYFFQSFGLLIIVNQMDAMFGI